MKMITDNKTLTKIEKILKKNIPSEELKYVARRYIYEMEYVGNSPNPEAAIINVFGDTYAILHYKNKAAFLTYKRPEEVEKYVVLLEADAISYNMKNWIEFHKPKTILVRRDKTVYVKQDYLIQVKPANSTELYLLQALYKECGGE